jgi:hypothetical protein
MLIIALELGQLEVVSAGPLAIKRLPAALNVQIHST